MLIKMESFRNTAQQKLTVADHLLSTTYSIVKEPKLLVSVIENIFQAVECAIVGLLEYEKNFKTIPAYGPGFTERLDLFRRKIAPKYGLDAGFMQFALGLKETLDEYKKASVAFTKKEKYVISDNDYNLRMLSADEVRKLLVKAKKYIDELFAITERLS